MLAARSTMSLRSSVRHRLRRDPATAFFAVVGVLLAAGVAFVAFSDPKQSPSALTTVATSGRRASTGRIVTGDQPLLLKNVQLRVLRASVDPGELKVRLRVRNFTARARRFSPTGRQVELRLGAATLKSAPSQAVVAAGAGSSVTLMFALTGRQTATLRRHGASYTLLVSEFAQQNGQGGLIQLRTR